MPRPAYHGLSSKLVLAFDVGTTFSGVSYCILEPGMVPEIQGVTRYPPQDQVGGGAKIPSILWYDEYGKVCAVGAEAEQQSVIQMAEDFEWHKVEWFKLHLCPQNMRPSDIAENDLKPLPPGKTVVDIYADTLKYLFECAQTYIRERHPNGDNLWNSLVRHAEIILSHPNGWDGAPQASMRRAAVAAGLVDQTTEGESRVHFVTEGEASLHFCISRAMAADGIMKGKGIVVVDAGGGTVDLSAYQRRKDISSFEEIAPQLSRVQGSALITRRAEPFFRTKLQGSKFCTADDIAEMVKDFDKKAKHSFRKLNEPAYVKFGSSRDKDTRVGIRGGQLTLSGVEVATLFQPSIETIIQALQEQVDAAKAPISDVLLVGGYAANDWLYSKLQEYCQSRDLNLCRPDGHVNKAVADGAVSFYVDHYVSVRVARTTYGVPTCIRFNPSDVEHQRRSHRVHPYPDGNLVLDNFSPILRKGTQVSETKEFKSSYLQVTGSRAGSREISSQITNYQGESHNPRWIDTEPSMFKPLCTVIGDTSQVAEGLTCRKAPNGRDYYEQEFEIVLSFGLTELKAQISWVEDGKEKRSPARIVYDDAGLITR